MTLNRRERLLCYSKILTEEVGYAVNVTELISDISDERIIVIFHAVDEDCIDYMLLVPALENDKELMTDRLNRRWRRPYND